MQKEALARAPIPEQADGQGRLALVRGHDVGQRIDVVLNLQPVFALRAVVPVAGETSEWPTISAIE